VCKNLSFEAIWILALFDVIAVVILGISPYEMNLRPIKEDAPSGTTPVGVQPCRSSLECGERILEMTTHNGCYL